jgi:hypothetical protein
MTMWPKLPSDHSSHLDDFSSGTGTSASIILSMSMPLRVERCVPSKMFERMPYWGWQGTINLPLTRVSVVFMLHLVLRLNLLSHPCPKQIYLTHFGTSSRHINTAPILNVASCWLSQDSRFKMLWRGILICGMRSIPCVRRRYWDLWHVV